MTPRRHGKPHIENCGRRVQSVTVQTPHKMRDFLPMNRDRLLFHLFLFLVATVGASPALRSQSTPRVNGDRMMEHLNAMAAIGKDAGGGVSRVAYSEADRQGREYVRGLMSAAGLNVSVDAAGNLSGLRAGREPGLPALVIGSHIDSVPQGGNYDGIVGSLGAIEVAQILAESHLALRHPLEVLIFQNEEGGLQGSRAISGELREEDLDQTTRSGKTLREGIAFIGGDPTRLASVRRKRGDIFAYLELHIEQGGTLAAEKIDIGVVEGIVGNHRWDVTIEGVSNHAGTTPMNQRHDALLAAAKFIEAVNRVVTSIPGRQVGTVGKIQAMPGAYNIIPGKVVLGLDVRDLDEGRIDMLFGKIHDQAQQIAEASGTKFSFQQVVGDRPALTDPRLRKLITDSAKQLNLSTKLLPSGATQDAQSMARLAPSGMIFIPSIGGISHAPEEFSRAEDVVNGVNVLLRAVLQLDSQSW
jgi:beta-ureidopropionase / N-carbamoyl-L-amino-acid hydrolase